MPRSEILPGVFLGDDDDGLLFKGPRIAVHEKNFVGSTTHWIPIMTGSENDDPGNYRASREALDAATSLMRHYHKRGIPFILHCLAGIERSPLVMACYLVRYEFQPNMNAAYDFIKSKRPQVQPRLHWLPAKGCPKGL